MGKIVTGWKYHNEELTEENKSTLSLLEYLHSGHFIQSTFENWESEFLQMGTYVILTVFLRQIGSSESKSLNEKESVDRNPDPLRKNAPWPVRRGGIILKLYRNSLSLTFTILFELSFLLHVFRSMKDYNDEQRRDGRAETELISYLTKPRLWFESFQNWQSEFVSVATPVILSIYLRQQGSPESKSVDAPHMENG
ncbi:MAG TPA: DUF6766 family protein [Cyclobacteriaceae bacterium]|nr:DUF6766 family protein [Cyclobacteriaceae bacterium]